MPTHPREVLNPTPSDKKTQTLSMPDYYVTVCSVCCCASCWHGEYMCKDTRGAETIEALASALHQEAREHPDNFSIAKLTEVCGAVRYAA